MQETMTMEAFTVSGTSLVTGGTIDYETKSSMKIYVNVNDGANDYAKAFTISVSDTLEPITDVGFAGVFSSNKTD